MSQREVRSFFDTLTVETREDSKPKITGYAAVFNSDSVDFLFFKEVIRPGAFRKTLSGSPDVRALLDHNTGQIVARTKAGNLRLQEDDKGLRCEIEPIDTEDGRKAIEWVRSGVVDGMSFGFEVREDRWGTKDGKNYRELIEVDLFEVSLVAFPAYPATNADLRSANQVWEKRQSELKQALNAYKYKLRVLTLHGS